MKKILLSLAVLMALGISAPVSAQRHRHTPRTEAVSHQAKTNEPKTVDNGKNGGEGIEAYSDTTSVANNDSAYAASDDTEPVDDSNRYSPSRFSDPFSWFAFLCSSSFMGVLFTLIVILMGLLFLFMPIIIVLLIIRYFIRRHNDRVRLAEKAMEQGKPLTEEEMPLSKKSPDYMWRRGVRNVSIGLGLMLFFWFLGATPLVGIGGLVACLGAGQMFMVRYNYNSKFGKKNDNGDDFAGFDDLNDDVTDLDFGDKDSDKK